MKKIIIYILLTMPLLALAQPGKFSVKGNLKGINGKGVAYLVTDDREYDEQITLFDGSFEFEGQLDFIEPLEATLIIQAKVNEMVRTERYPIYLEAGTLLFESDGDSLLRANIIGSPLNREYQNLQQQLAPIQLRRDQLKKRYSLLSKEEKENKSMIAPFTLEQNKIEQAFKDVYWNTIQANPNSFLSLKSLQKYVGHIPDYDTAYSLFENLNIAIRSTPSGQQYASYLANIKDIAIGQVAPPISLPDTAGTMVHLSDFKGKYVLVDFWASWCGPCREENKNLVKIYETYHPKGLEVLAVSVDIEIFKKNWLDAIKMDNLPWKHVSNLQIDNPAAKRYGIRAVPQNVLVDPNGIIIGKNLKGDALREQLAKLL